MRGSTRSFCSWQSRSNLTTTWSFDSNGFVQPGPLAILRPTEDLSDYSFEFLGEVEHRAVGAAFRARDLDNYYAVKFIEDDFLGGERIDPSTDGRPDSRTNVPEADSQLGDLREDFDFTQQPLPPPLVANGKVFVGTQTGVAVFGLLN